MGVSVNEGAEGYHWMARGLRLGYEVFFWLALGSLVLDSTFQAWRSLK